MSDLKDMVEFWGWLEEWCGKLLGQDDAVKFFYKWSIKNKTFMNDWDTLRAKIAKAGSQRAAVSACLKTAIILFENRKAMAKPVAVLDGAEIRRNKAQSIAMVRRHFRSNNEDADDDVSDVIAVHTFEVENARVDMSMSLTLNLGNFESATIRRGLSVPCYTEEVSVVEKNMSEWITSRIRNDRRRIKGQTDFVDEPDLGLTGNDQEKFGDEDDSSLLPGD